MNNSNILAALAGALLLNVALFRVYVNFNRLSSSVPQPFRYRSPIQQLGGADRQRDRASDGGQVHDAVGNGPEVFVGVGAVDVPEAVLASADAAPVKLGHAMQQRIRMRAQPRLIAGVAVAPPGMR